MKIAIVIPPFFRWMGSHQNRVLPGPMSLALSLSYVGYDVRLVNGDDAPGNDEYADWRSCAENFWGLEWAVRGAWGESVWRDVAERALAHEPECVFVFAGDHVIPTVDLGGIDVCEAQTRAIRALDSDVRTVAFGTQLLGLLDDHREPFADVTLLGEPEGQAAYCATAAQRGEIVRSVVLKEFERLIRVDLELLEPPLPKGHDLDYVYGTRGCLWDCHFCLVTQFGRSVRPVSAAAVIREMGNRYWHGAEQVYLCDMVMPFSRQRVVEFAAAKKLWHEKNVRPLPWYCEARVDTVDPFRATLMAEAGCTAVKMGVEFGDDETMETMGKRSTWQRAVDAVQVVKENGMKAIVYVMVGYPGGNRARYLAQLERMRSLEASHYVVNVTAPYPGTELWKTIRSQGVRTHLSTDMKKLWGVDDDVLQGFHDLAGRKEDQGQRRYVEHRLSESSGVEQLHWR